MCIFVSKTAQMAGTSNAELRGVEFIRRYLLHTLPDGFHRIRYRGFLHSKGKGGLELLQTLLDARIRKSLDPESGSTDAGTHAPLCPKCQKEMHLLKPLARAPPSERNVQFFNRVMP